MIKNKLSNFSNLPILHWLLLTLIMLIFSNFSISYAQFESFCGNNNIYTFDEEIVQSLILSENFEPDKEKSKLIQCGLPGLSWKVCRKCESNFNQNLLKSVTNMLSSKSHRDWHYSWHSIRAELDEGMNGLHVSIDRLQELVRNGWIPSPRKNVIINSLVYKDFRKFKSEHSSGGNLAGEDFLFMHRQMIKMVQAHLSANKDSCIAPWKKLPKLFDKNWPTQRAFYSQEKYNSSEYEAKELEEIIYLSEKFLDNMYLSNVSLNRLGLDIESQIHGKLHILYASPKSNCDDPNLDNNSRCDDLDHDRSSHVNKYFWKLHGYIDQLISNWLKANDYKYIYKNCIYSPNPDQCYQWKGTWLGKEPKMADYK